MIARFRLNKRFHRPVVSIVCGGERCEALFDTGADIPVFTLGQQKMEALGGRLQQKDFHFGGFGGSCDSVLYRMEVGLGPFRYVDLPIACVYDMTMPFAFILLATMFTGFVYTIDDLAHTLTVDTRTNTTDLHLRVDDGLGGFRILTGATDISADRAVKDREA